MKITITEVHKRYGDVVALDGPTFEIPSGSTFGILGTNGAGKTTLFKLLVGHDSPDTGHIEVGGLDVETAGHRVRERVGYLPEHSGFPPSMTGREVLSVHARIRGLENRAERIEECLELVDLTEAADRRVSGYSNGMGRRLGLASVLLSRPPVLVLDEPTAGLDPRGVAAFHRIIERIDRETDATVVLSSHVLSEVERLCDEVVILQDGELRAAGPVEELRRRAGNDRVTVTVHPASPNDRPALLEVVQGYGGVASVGGSRRTDVDAADDHPGTPLAVVCDRESSFDLVTALGEADRRDLVDRFEVREAGLEAAFHAVLDDSNVPGSAGAARERTNGATSAEAENPDAAAATEGSR